MKLLELMKSIVQKAMKMKLIRWIKTLEYVKKKKKKKKKKK